MIPPMKFDYMSWEAAATLFTGILAVAGATAVAWRQGNILKRQADIQESQTDILAKQASIQDNQHRLERLNSKSQLFDRRYRVFSEFAVFLDYALEPQNSRDPQLSGVIEGTRQNVERSRFLFGPEVHARLSMLFDLGVSQLVEWDVERVEALHAERTTLQDMFLPYLTFDDALLRE